jgi:hypothetical protein
MSSKKDRKNSDRTRAPRGLFTRRRFVKSAGAATVAIGFGTTTIGAEELPRVDETDPTAKALNYVHDAGSVDAAKRLSDQFCNNCALYAGNEDDEWAGCSIFPGKAVAGRGWCSVWAPKQAS